MQAVFSIIIFHSLVLIIIHSDDTKHSQSNVYSYKVAVAAVIPISDCYGSSKICLLMDFREPYTSDILIQAICIEIRYF